MTTIKQNHGENAPVRALGLMSGTSLDGVDAAIIETDGIEVFDHGPVRSTPYDPAFRARLREVLGKESAPAELIVEFTKVQADFVLALLEANNLSPADIDLIGFHGQTIFHDPANRLTVQIGDGVLMAELTGIDTVAEFRHADVASGGEGAPFAPLYHRALATELEGPLAVLNLGGVGNVTYIEGETVLAFDTGPANALLDDWVLTHTGQPFDEGGKIAATGQVNEAVLAQLLDNPYFDLKPPKSLDRDEFPVAAAINGLGLEEGAATLLHFTSESIRRALPHLPGKPARWLLTGGGRKNPALVQAIEIVTQVPVEPVEAVGWRGDDLEAEAFAFLAVRSVRGLPLSLPTTTGVPEPMTGGRFYAAPSKERVRA
ncbi:anhydro-N-acetylmuramic acid kinase [Sneathiella sp. HT1-7]|jgi:anhydro-N-acetylmuramic acid kinase|uniref:anhydro-N-acetylmuramic acid kinase n=1 Tax=Sneathiella sp. HT1-7 TaxID=2887192 RepID=UPI001D15A4B0|nr:anhydro-N-acetylmuramic acid kinase [Sneathiella sp. HT1-7]MCC3304891.1 anhydro-N-acetylmuramic acid kinase [Sneathiella sp. HT1-7]